MFYKLKRVVDLKKEVFFCKLKKNTGMTRIFLTAYLDHIIHKLTNYDLEELQNKTDIFKVLSCINHKKVGTSGIKGECFLSEQFKRFFCDYEGVDRKIPSNLLAESNLSANYFFSEGRLSG